MIRAGLAVLVLALSLAAWQSMRLHQARAALAQAEAAVRGYQEADRWRAADERRRADQAALDLELQRGAGNEAPLSDYLRRGAGRVWP